MFKRTLYLTAICIGLLVSAGVSNSKAQIKQEQIGYVNPQAVLQKMPEMKAVQQRLQNFVETKRKAIADQQQTFQNQVSDYQQRQGVMSDDAKKTEETKLGKLRANLQKAQSQAQQEIQKKQEELVGPLNEEIRKSINSVAQKKNLSYVLNTQTNSGDLIILYASDDAKQKYDITSEVMDDLGIGK